MNRKATEELCKIYYDEKKFNHAKRVANKAEYLSNLFCHKNDFIYELGFAHDLYEDTEIIRNIWFDKIFEDNLEILTRKPYEDYIDYIKNIRKFAHQNKDFLPAYIVKLADIWDHLNQTETLTEKRKEKYLKALPYLL